MIFVKTLKEARAMALDIDGTYRKCSGGWLVMSWSDYKVWKEQK